MLKRPSKWPAASSPEFPPFEIELGGVEVFPKTNVIYIGLRLGLDEMRAMHQAMNTGPLAFAEPYAYHPHITLAQEFAAGRYRASRWRCARKRWQE